MQSSLPLVASHMNNLYPLILQHILKNGEQVSPRGQLTREIRPLSFTLTNPLNRFITLRERNANYAFALLEALQFIGGTTSGEQQARYNSNIKNWLGAKDGQIEAPYGVLTADQVPYVVDTLAADPDSRQALLSIYHGPEHQKPMLNVPCTCTLQFFVRNDKLELVVYMRSNDLWWGVPYDVFQFTTMQEMIALALGKELGPYTHIAGSSHIYEPFFEKAQKLVDNRCPHPEFHFDDQPQLLSITQPYHPYSVDVLIKSSQSVLLHETKLYGTLDEIERADELWGYSDPYNLIQYNKLFYQHLEVFKDYQESKIARRTS